MRTYEHMMQLLLDFALCDPRVRAVILNGSRVYGDAPADPFSDIDILFLVTELSSFLGNHHWVDFLGETMVRQLPDLLDNPNGPYDSFGYLLQFCDGNRVDLSLVPMKNAGRLVPNFGPGELVLDKDGGAERYLTANPDEFLVARPTITQYQACCNEFWWVAPYIAKGIWRDQLNYAMDHFYILKECLYHVLGWYIGGQHGYTVTIGKSGKYLNRYLTPQEWALFVRTFPAGDYDAIWQALYAMCSLFAQVAQAVAKDIGTTYPAMDDEKVTAHLQYVQALPTDANALYPDKT